MTLTTSNQSNRMNFSGERVDTFVRFDKVDYSHQNGTKALLDVSLKISPGEVVAIMGTNGAGKSTLVKHINGLLKPIHGVVQVFGIDTRKNSSAQLSRRVGIVFQNPNNQLFAQTVKAEVEFALRNFGFSEDVVAKRTNWALNTFGLEAYVNTPPMELSGGEKKRLCIALVLAWDPDILILDEPTVGQDSEQKEKIVQTIRMLQKQSKTVILVTHDVEFVWPIQPRVILMSQGRIVADGSSQTVLGNVFLTERSSVLAPQLVKLWSHLDRSEDYPRNVFEAKNRLNL